PAAFHGNCDIADAGARKSRRRTQTRGHEAWPARNNDRFEHHGEESRRSELRASMGDRRGSWRLRLRASKQCGWRRSHEVLLPEQFDRQSTRHHHWCGLSLFWWSSRPASATHGRVGSWWWLYALPGRAMGAWMGRATRAQDKHRGPTERYRETFLLRYDSALCAGAGVHDRACRRRSRDARQRLPVRHGHDGLRESRAVVEDFGRGQGDHSRFARGSITIGEIMNVQSTKAV